MIKDDESGVMSGFVVLWAGIAQSHYQFSRIRHFYPGEKQQAGKNGFPACNTVNLRKKKMFREPFPQKEALSRR
jgi:hypothetical protein